jgi:pimeloyl-ACP methyl ester carboxylesterase
MGGFIVQEAAIRHQERLLSLASIMSSTGDRRVGQPRPEVTPFLLAPPPHTREAALDRAATLWRAIGSPGFPFDEAKVRRDAGAAWDRNHEYAGVGRQLAAILTMRDRTADLARVSVPTVVIHGKDDPLVDVSGGEATAKAVPGARLVLVPGMGHDLPVGVWPVVLDALVANAKRADGEASH